MPCNVSNDKASHKMLVCFYRAKHAWRDTAVHCCVRPSVSLSVTLVGRDHIHGDSRKIISRINRVILPLLVLVIPTSSENSKGISLSNFGGDLQCGVGKNHIFVPVTRHISETVPDRRLVTMHYHLFLFVSPDTFTG